MSIAKSTGQQAFELKGSVLTVMVLQIKEPNPEKLYPQLTRKIEPGRAFFAGAPVMVDVGTMDDELQESFDCQGIADLLRELGLVPVAIRGAIAALHAQAREAGLGVLPAIKGEKKVAIEEGEAHDEMQPQPEKEKEQEQERVDAAEAESSDDSGDDQGEDEPAQVIARDGGQAAKTLVVRKPVRSGQQILAPNGDVIVLSSVNAGAEVLAAGNIHVYGALRGRAMAGINGDTSARIFSMQCNPEMVSVAGEYLVNEMLSSDVVNRSVIIAREGDSLLFTHLD